MSMFDVLRTPPPASLAAMLSLPGTDGQCSLWSTSTHPNMYTATQSLANEELSSSDKENSPSYALPSQRRAESASPIMNVFKISPFKENMSFTPPRVRPPPRAWERRPAKPFVLRNEGQKIWKRIPLQELGVDTNQQVSKREKEEKESYLRIVKRLRLDDDLGANAGAKRADVMPAIGTKWEEESIEKGGSPKKKRIEREAQPKTLKETSEKHNLAILDQNDSCDGEKDLRGLNNSSENSPSVLAREHTSSYEIHPTSRTTHNTTDFDNEQSPDVLVGEKVVDLIVREGIETVEENCGDPSGDIMSTESCAVDDQLPTGNEAIKLNQDDVPLVVQIGSGLDVSVCAPNDDTNEDTEDSVGNVQISQPPSTPSKGSETVTVTTASSLDESLATEVDSTAVGILAQQVLLPADHEETAFLRDFLERAQASKAARIAISPQKKSAPMMDQIAEPEQDRATQFALDDTEAVDDIEDDDLSPPLETAHAEQMFSSEDIKVSSPTRRSARTAARAASSRLPYFQFPSTSQFGPALPSHYGTSSLPNTIQLKRATGGEFVFNAKSQQTLAMMTRSNTKRNQGDAIRVAQRLAQIKKELEVRQCGESTPESAAPQDERSSLETVATAEQDLRTTYKKRKRDKQDEGRVSKTRRNVRWPDDEQLVRYREPSPSSTASENVGNSDKKAVDVSASGEVQSENMSEVSENGEPATVDRQSSKAKKEDCTEDSSKLKVRRIRKIKLDSVNGTPAPKTRSRSVLEMEPVDAGTRTTTATGASSIVSSIRKSSRMPVPISTSIPLPGFSSTRSKIQSIAKDKDRERARATPLATRASSSTSTSLSECQSLEQSSNHSSEEHKSEDGRRRLRGRS